MGFLVGFVLGWLVGCLIIMWMYGPREGWEYLVEFHKFIIRPWKYR